MKNTEPMQNELEKIQNDFQVFMRKNVEKIGFDEFIENGEIFKNFDEAADAYCEFLNGLTTTDTIQTLAAIFEEKSGEFCRLENAHDSTHAKALILFLIFTAQKFATRRMVGLLFCLGCPTFFCLKRAAECARKRPRKKWRNQYLTAKCTLKSFLNSICANFWISTAQKYGQS